MIYKYIRFSTDQQDERSQNEIIDQYLTAHGITADATFKDEGVSGGVTFYERKLYTLVKQLNEGDTIIVSEISRLGRSMSDLNTLINAELKPRKARLIIIKMSLDLDCSNLKAIDEMILFAFSFSAQIEKEMIQERTRAALDQRKSLLQTQGYFVSKAGNVVTTLGNGSKPTKQCHTAAGESSSQRAENDESNQAFAKCLAIYMKDHPQPERGDIMAWYGKLAAMLNALGYTTRSGEPYDANRAYNAHRCLKRRMKNRKEAA